MPVFLNSVVLIFSFGTGSLKNCWFGYKVENEDECEDGWWCWRDRVLRLFWYFTSLIMTDHYCWMVGYISGSCQRIIVSVWQCIHSSHRHPSPISTNFSKPTLKYHSISPTSPPYWLALYTATLTPLTNSYVFYCNTAWYCYWSNAIRYGIILCLC